MIRMDLLRGSNDCPFAAARRMVDAGAADGPAQVFYDGKHCLTLRSLHESALLTVFEEPKLRLAPWVPHPRSTVSVAMQALLDQRAVERAAKKAARP